MVVEHSVVIRVTSFEDLQLTSTGPVLHRLLMICKAYDVVANIWVLILCTAGTPFKCINEKLGAETGDLAMTYKLAVAAVGLCRHAVRMGGGFSWEWSNGNELWDLVVVRNFFTKCGSSFCLVSTAVVGQFVDRKGGVFYVKKKVESRDDAAQAHRSHGFECFGRKRFEESLLSEFSSFSQTILCSDECWWSSRQKDS